MTSTRNGASWAKRILHPPKYLTASILVSLGGLLNGYVILLLLPLNC
jgi:hypothetical protein